MPTSPTPLPQARAAGLITQRVENELIVYDRITDRAHVLNAAAALVWQHCDGTRSAAQLAEIAARELGTPVTEQVIWYTVARLQEQELLDKSAAIPAPIRGLTRREFITKFALTAALIPVVKTIQAPGPQQAVSCVDCDSFPCCPPLICDPVSAVCS